MVSSISYLLGQNKRVTGFGVPRRRIAGRGVVRNLSATAVKYVGNKIVDSLANMIRGSNGGSWRVTGTGKGPRKARKTMSRRPRARTTTRKTTRPRTVRKARRTLLKRRR